MDISGKEYQEHGVFEDLKAIEGFYRALSDSVFSYTTQGTRALGNIDSYVYSSIEGSIESMRVVLLNGRINDTYALLRKYYDSAIMNVYVNLYLNDKYSLECLLVEQIDNWMNGRAPLPAYRVMSQYIRDSPRLASVTDKLFRSNDTYKAIRDRCNDHTHYNFFGNALYNDNEVHLPNRIKHLRRIQIDVIALFVMHFSLIMQLNPHYMRSMDCIDYLECGMQPPEGCEYWVSPYVQDMFDRFVARTRPDIAQLLAESTSMCIQLGDKVQP